MFHPLCFSSSTIKTTLSLLILVGVFGVATVRSQEVAPGRPVLDFDGNKIFSKPELQDVANKCLDQYVDAAHPYESEQLEYCLHKVRNYIAARGYLQVKLGKTLYAQNGNVSQATIPVEEGALYRIGEIKIEDAKVLAPAQIITMIGLNPGDVADADKLTTAIFERVKEAYGNLGYIRYTAEITPTFHLKDGADEGVADFTITIDEAAQFRIRSIKFTGGDSKTNELLRRELLVRDGEVYNADLFSKSITRMNNTGLFERIDADRDVEYQTDEKAAMLDLTIRLKKRIASAANP